MKKTLLAFFIVFQASIFCVHGQGRFQNGEYDVLVRLDGDVFWVRDSSQVRLQASTTLNDGTVVNANGTYSTVNFKRLQLSEGECLDSGGAKYSNEYEYRRRIVQENKNLNPLQVQERNENRYHIIFIKGEVFQITYYKQDKITNNVDLGYGKILQPNGIHRTSYGRSRLKEGGCITITGRPLIDLYEHRKTIVRKEKRVLKKLLKEKKTV